MHDAPGTLGGGRGSELLLLHCHALTCLDATRPPAARRLEDAVGVELARLLVRALSGPGKPAVPALAA